MVAGAYHDVASRSLDHVTEAGLHASVSALVYVAPRAPDAGEDYAALAKRFPTPPASAGIVFDGDEGRLSEAAFLRDFASDVPEVKARALYAVQQPFNRTPTSAKLRRRPGARSRASMPCRPKIGSSTGPGKLHGEAYGRRRSS